MFFILFFTCAQYHISGSIVDEDDKYVEGAIVKLISEDGSVIKTEATNKEGFFLVKYVEEGRYSLQFGMVGRMTKNMVIDIAGSNVDDIKIVLPFSDGELPEAVVSAKKPQYRIYKKDYLSIAEDMLVRKPIHSGFNFYHERRLEWQKFCGKWQWKSPTGDTIFTVLLRTEIVPIFNGSNKAKAGGIMKNNFSIRYTRDLLVGWYELRVNDSIVFSNMSRRPKITSFTEFTETQKQCLIGVFEQSGNDNIAHFTLRKNPLDGADRGFLVFSLLGKEEDIALWNLWVMIKNTSGYALVEKAKPADFAFPVKVIMKKIEDW